MAARRTLEYAEANTAKICARCASLVRDYDSGFVAGGQAVMASLFEALTSPQVGMNAVEADRIVQSIAEHAGVTLV